jgi:hypothetical protein
MTAPPTSFVAPPASLAEARPSEAADGPHRPWPLLATAAMLLSLAAELPLLRVYGRPGLRLIVLAAGPAVLTAIAARAGAGRRFRGFRGFRDGRSPVPAIVGVIAGIIVGAAPGLLIAGTDQFGPGGLVSRLVTAIRDGWLRILSVPVPVPYTRSFTDLPVLLAAGLAALITVIALSRRPAIALAPAAVGFGGLLVLGVHGPGSGLLLAGAFALASAIFLIAVGQAPASRPIATAAAVVAILVTAALVVLAWQPATQYDPRTAVRVPVRAMVAQDPLALLPARLETPQALVFTARLSGALLAHPRNWVVLAYENYDGAGWLSAGSASPVAIGGPAPSAVGTGSAIVSLYQPTTLLPHPSYLLSTVPADLEYGSAPELLAAPRGLRRYTVHASVAEPSAHALTLASAPTGVPALLTQVPACVPSAVKRLATQASQQASVPPEQAVRIEQLLKFGRFRYQAGAAPGEGCGSLSRMFTTHHGTSAQFATAFALAARLLGLPARVAVGYLPGHVDAGTDTVTDADAYAWPQVLLTGVGWVDFDPTPRAGTSASSPAREKQPAVSKIKVQKPSRSATKTVPKITTPKVPPVSGSGPWTWIVLSASALILALLVVLTFLWGRPRWRRLRRRRAPEPAIRALGAWYEVLPALERVGVPVQSRSASGVAATAATVVADDTQSIGRLAVLAERALYDEVADQDAIMAWQLSDHARAAIAVAARSASTRHSAANARWRRGV